MQSETAVKEAALRLKSLRDGESTRSVRLKKLRFGERELFRSTDYLFVNANLYSNLDTFTHSQACAAIRMKALISHRNHRKHRIL